MKSWILLCQLQRNIIVLNIGDMRVMEVYVYNLYVWWFFIFYHNYGCILDFTTKMCTDGYVF